MPSLIPGLFIPCVISMKSHGHGRDCKIKRMVVQSILLLILEDWEQSWKADKARATEAREMDKWGTVIIQKKSVKGKSHAFSDQQHETGSKYQKVRAGGLPSPTNWWKILTMTAAQNNLGQGKHLLYTVGFRLSLWGSAPDKVESPSWVVPLGLRSWSTSTILSNTKEIISPLININGDKHWLFYFTHARVFFSKPGNQDCKFLLCLNSIYILFNLQNLISVKNGCCSAALGPLFPKKQKAVDRKTHKSL